MKSAHAPEGYYTHVAVSALVGEGWRCVSWDTPMALLPAMHKAPEWMRQSLRADKVRGRSKITEWKITARYCRGVYERRER
jgi:hypothetical protein